MSRYQKPWYNSYRSMMGRCYNVKSQNYKYYGGRGIKVCAEWHDFNNFDAWAKETYIEGYTLDRVDNDKGYCPSNCRWASKKEQANHKRNTRILTIKGISHTISEWAEISGINRSTINNRVCRGWADEDVLTMPVTHGNQYTFLKAVEKGERYDPSVH